MQDVAIVVGLLAACLVALVLVLLARREAAAVRRQATEDVQSIRDEARAALADAQRREARAAAERAAADRLAAADREAVERLEATSGLTAAEARTELLRQLTAEAATAASASIRRIEAQARRT